MATKFKVKATQKGYYGNLIREPGDVFIMGKDCLRRDVKTGKYIETRVSEDTGEEEDALPSWVVLIEKFSTKDKSKSKDDDDKKSKGDTDKKVRTGGASGDKKVL